MIRADGALVDSCLRGDRVHKAFAAVLGHVPTPLSHPDAYRLIPEGPWQKRLVARMLKNGSPI